MNRTENGHNHIQDCITSITDNDLQAVDMQVIASPTINLLNSADKNTTEKQGVLFLISVLRDRQEEDTIENKKDNLVVAGIVWKALDQTQQLLITDKLRTYDEASSIDKGEMNRIKTRFTTFINKFK